MEQKERPIDLLFKNWSYEFIVQDLIFHCPISSTEDIIGEEGRYF